MTDESKIALSALGNIREKVEIEGIDGTPIIVTIKPLTWEQEYRIAAVVAEKIKRGVPENIADRDYMLLSVKEGIEDPDLSEPEIMELKVGVVSELSRRIAKLSGHAQKKESKTS